MNRQRALEGKQERREKRRSSNTPVGKSTGTYERYSRRARGERQAVETDRRGTNNS